MTKVIPILKGLHDNHYFDDGYLIDPLTSSVTLIQTDKHNILVDTGTPNFKDKIIENLARENLKLEDINYLILTHGHLDHTFNAHLFPKALIYTQMAFWHWQHSNCRIFMGGVAEDEIPGVKLIHTPGHTNDSLSVFVIDSEGGRWVVAGDAVNIHYVENGSFKQRAGKVGMKSLQTVVDLKPDFIVPGHGDVLREREIEVLRRFVENK